MCRDEYLGSVGEEKLRGMRGMLERYWRYSESVGGLLEKRGYGEVSGGISGADCVSWFPVAEDKMPQIGMKLAFLMIG
ncbi:predicted protein [Sclerotinia sclerotiorum 1980 UF-70]|uniref:Uncharacterized protein n=1 Tax=Sclerotinia sclerotiorum (strain ATCC 18683 / 1980 / Ss-1) TaxID=665079 RepID=A7ENH3_SCLS1|nr:predicted protein [Sclerotinia sclerotiorum 1980 UF-70]EDO04389.1 predicted protein [Sclerotinia sclerotiorum 1980 UF-70]